ALARRRTPATSEVLHLDRQGLSALAELPMAAQRQLLERSVSDIEQRATYLDSDRRWARGDLGGVAEEVRSMRRGQPALYEALVAGRSRRWAPRIAALLAQPGSSVVIVGAGHMVGRDGLPALLRAQGLRVEGPTVR
ncbi:MAG TPA: TraB/GumN family protein, partial [Caulobacteraceae bacterium]